MCGYFSRICQAVSNSATGCPSYLSFRICWHCLQVEAQWSSTNYKILHVQIAAKTQWSAFCKKTKGTLHIIQQLQVTTRCCTGIIFFWTKVSIVPNDDAESCNLYFSHVHRQSSWYQSIGKWPIIQNINLIGQRCYAFLSTTLFKGRVEGRRPHLHRSTWARHLRHTWARHLRHTWAWQWFYTTQLSNETHPGWRIIPVSKWLVTAMYKPFRPFGRGITPVGGLTNLFF